MKRCSKCKTSLDEAQFHNNRSKADGLSGHCKDCSKAATYNWRTTHPVEFRDYNKQWRERNPEKVQEGSKRYRANHREECRTRCKNWYHSERGQTQNRKFRYGLSEADYQELYAVTQGACYVCGSEVGISIDHDHASGVVRGLLCGNCNRAAGILKDDSDRAIALSAYLKAAMTRSPQALAV